MATRMQQRKGTAAQWTAANPVLNAGEMGWESDTNKFKIGDGTNHWDNLTYFLDGTDTGFSAADYLLATSKGAISGVAALDADTNVLTKTGVVFEGATANDFETTLVVIDPTADRTITFQDANGTVVLRDSTDTLTNKSISLATNTVTSTLAQLNTAVTDADVASLAGTETLTNKTLTSPVINTPTGIAKTDVGLGSVDNTTDADKPVSTAGQTALNLKADLSGPTFTGTPTLPTGTIAITQTAGNNSTAIATTAYADAAVAALVDSAPATLNTLNELADALGDDASFATTVSTNLGLKAPLASPTFTGTVTIPSGASINGFALLAGPTFTGTVTLDTGAVLGTPASGTLTNLTGLPVSTGISGLGSNVATFLATPSSANFASMISDEIGTGNVVLSEYATSAQTESYTTVLADKGKIVEMNVGSANNITIPPNSSVAYPVGTSINIVQIGSGQTTVVAGSGVTINATPGLKLRTQFSSATCVKRAEDTWILFGDIVS